MGFALFDQSGTFNPLDYGLSPGDNLAVIAVGGGGGGGAGMMRAYYNDVNYYRGHLPGGTGGTSSFGAYVTALGGAGGAGWGAYRSSWSTSQPISQPTANATQGRYLAKTVNSNTGNSIATAGAAGWLPGYAWYADNASDDLRTYVTGDAERTCLKFRQSPGLSGYPAFGATQIWHVQSSNYQRIYTEYPNDALYCPVLAPVFIINYYNNYPYIGAKVHQRLLSISGGNGCRPVNSTSNHADACVPAFGGLGYGAGGGGASAAHTTSYSSVRTTYGGNGGNSGEVVYANVQLTSLEPIAITVGGGGGGAGWACYGDTSSYKSYAYEGKAGTAGAGGAACSSNHVNAGGYGSTPGGHGISAANDAYTSYQLYHNNYGRYVGAGGGAGGCVAIWW